MRTHNVSEEPQDSVGDQEHRAHHARPSTPAVKPPEHSDHRDQPQDLVDRSVVVGLADDKGAFDSDAAEVMHAQEKVGRATQVLAHRDTAEAPNALSDRQAENRAVQQRPTLGALPGPRDDRGNEHRGDESATELQAALPHRDDIKWRTEFMHVSGRPQQPGTYEP